jgi:glucan phosphorylase
MQLAAYSAPIAWRHFSFRCSPRANADGLPHSWLARIRASIRTLAPAFCAERMLEDYLQRSYAPTETSA